ncbi:hypothetical protein B0919_06615 [Hymenobacter sp. CRA2]|nr:hypothetical protein B0919_06615 [Hymenobacter sp. CRA2]
MGLRAAVGLAWLNASGAWAQAPAPALPVAQAFENYSQQDAHEKLFLHLDRSLYVGGDIMWFKLYAVAGSRHQPLPLSKVAYVEVLDAKQRPVLQGKIELKQAAGHGSFQLPATLASGRYTVRAYTNWMKNFGPEYYFHSTVTVVNTFAERLPAAADSAGIDVQFFPEGGNLVKGLPSKVGFKVADKTGRGLDAEGVLLDPQNKVVARFKTLKFGMGRFAFTPTEAGKAYTAVVKLPGQQTVTSQAPAVNEQGYVLSLDDAGPNQVSLSVRASGPAAASGPVYVLGHAGQQAFVATSLPLANSQGQLLLDKSRLPEGVLHFTAFDAQQRPVCERLYFQRPKAQLSISAAADRRQYGTRDKVSLSLRTNDGTGAEAPANLSVAVYRLDSLATRAATAADISSYLWLTSDLPGVIENPGYYLRDSSAEADEAADNLMLTQGWRRFSWDKVLAGGPLPRPYVPEFNGHLVQGRVFNKHTNQPAAQIPAYLAAPGVPVRMYSSLSDANGAVHFEVRDLYGPKNLVLQTNTRQDSIYRFEIHNPFSAVFVPRPAPGLALPELYRPELTQRHLQMQAQNAYFRKPLSAFAQPLADSVSLYGKASELYRLDDYTRFKVMEEVMREYVPGVQVRLRKDGFHFMVVDKVSGAYFDDDPMVLLDGVPFFDINRVMKMDPLKIKTLEVMDGRFMQAGLMYSGIVSYTTYKGDLAGYRPDARALVQEYEGLQWEREFYSPRYATAQQQQSRLPDLRNLLYWNPQVLTSSASGQQLEFYTSDEAGKYVVVVQGLADSGLAGSRSFTFEVKASGVAQAR